MGANEKLASGDDRYLESYAPGKESFKILDERVRPGGNQDYNAMGSYDSYKPQSSLSEKIGNIMQGVDLATSKIEKQDRFDKYRVRESRGADRKREAGRQGV